MVRRWATARIDCDTCGKLWRETSLYPIPDPTPNANPSAWRAFTYAQFHLPPAHDTRAVPVLTRERVSAWRERSHRPCRCFQRQWRAETAYHISHHALHNLVGDAIGRFSSQQNRGPLATLGSVSRLAQCARDEEVH